MSYDIELVNKKTGKTASMRHPQYVRGGTVPAIFDPATGELVQAEQSEASINITFNYSRYYYEATDGDIRFAHDEVSARYADGTEGPIVTKYGLPGLDGTTPAESIPMLMDMVEKISKKYRDKNSLEWIITKREKKHYFKDGKELKNISIDDVLHKQYDETKDITYHIS